MAEGAGGGFANSPWPWVIGAAASGIGAVVNARTANKNRQSEAELERLRLQQLDDIDRRALAHKESTLNPFRNQLDQATTIGTLDRLERGSYQPVKFTGGSSRYAGNIPQFSGGFSYEKSPELIASAGSLKRNVMGGNTAPTMTNPANYGKSAALDLVRMSADGVDPAGVNASGGRPVGAGQTPAAAANTDYLEGVARRGGSGGGGVGSGAVKGATLGGSVAGFAGAGVGAVVGGIAGAFGKTAPTAPRDLDVATATEVLTKVMRAEEGREPMPGEIAQMLAGQGLKPGDRWVGEAGMMALIESMRANGQGSMQPSYTAHG